MKKITLGAIALVAGASAANAGGLDRSGQSVLQVFNESGSAELSFGIVRPSVTGTDGANSYDVGDSYNQFTMSFTQAVSDRFSFTAIVDQPFGANVTYNNAPTTSALGGTTADLSSTSFSLLGKYQVTDRVSVFGGVRFQRVGADVALNGTAYASAISVAAVAGTVAGLEASLLGAALGGDLAAAATIDGTYGAGTTAALGVAVTNQVTSFATNNGYNVNISDSHDVGYTLGAAYEIPDIALRFAATYHSEMEHTADTVENIFGATVNGTTTYKTPQSINLEFQTGIAKDTLLTASYRWTEFSSVDVIPTALGSDLVNLDDSHRYTIGVARRFSDAFAGSLSFSYEPWTDGLVSPLGPTDGQFGITLAGRYEKENVTISGGINYSWLGNAQAGVADQAVATFSDNSAIGVGLKVKVTF